MVCEESRWWAHLSSCQCLAATSRHSSPFEEVCFRSTCGAVAHCMYSCSAASSLDLGHASFARRIISHIAYSYEMMLRKRRRPLSFQPTAEKMPQERHFGSQNDSKGHVRHAVMQDFLRSETTRDSNFLSQRACKCPHTSSSTRHRMARPRQWHNDKGHAALQLCAHCSLISLSSEGL